MELVSIPKYEKFVLAKGFIIIKEKSDTTEDWFPYIVFFDENGKRLFCLPREADRQFFDGLRSLNSRTLHDDGLICEFTTSSENYSLSHQNRQLQIHRHRYINNSGIRQDIHQITISRLEGQQIYNSLKKYA